MYKIYCCTDIENGYKYIGLTSKDLNVRLKAHLDEAKYSNVNSPFKQAIREGRKFTTSILKDNIASSKEAAYWEKYYIKLYNTYIGNEQCKGYNGTSGGEVVPDELKNKECVFMYGLDGSFLDSFKSISDASRYAGVSRPALTNVLKGDGITCGGYQWRLINDDRPVIPVLNGMDNIRKQIDKYDLDGNYIDTYESVQEAADSIGTYSSSIIKVCKGKHHSHKGFIWRYSNDRNDVLPVSETSKSGSTKRGVIQLDLNLNVINVFESASMAYYNTGVSITSIRRACSNPNFTAGGYKWQFESDSKSNNKGRITKARQIGQYDLQNNLISIYESMSDASKKSGIERTAIFRCCNNKTKQGGGYIWKYLD